MTFGLLSNIDTFFSLPDIECHCCLLRIKENPSRFVLIMIWQSMCKSIIKSQQESREVATQNDIPFSFSDGLSNTSDVEETPQEPRLDD